MAYILCQLPKPRTRPGHHDLLFGQSDKLYLYQVGDIGLEPTTFAMSTQRSNQLS